MTQTGTSGWEGLLADGERIVWQGRPEPGIVWRDLLSFQSIFGLFFAGFASFWIAGAMAVTLGQRSTGGIDGVFAFFPLFGLPFLLVGLHMMVGRLFWDDFVRKRTWYTLTDQAALIATDIFGRRRLKRFPIADMSDIDLIDGAPGSVIFAEELRVHSSRKQGRNGMSGMRRTSTQRVPIGFRRIADARAVYRQILNLRDVAQRA